MNIGPNAIDDIKVKIAGVMTQVDAIYQGATKVWPLVVSTPYADYINSLNPVAYWRLGESSGTVAVDETGNHDGTYVNSPTLGVSGLLFGDNDTAVEFDGLTNYCEIPDVITDDTVPMSVSFIWHSPDSNDLDRYHTLIGMQHMVGLRRIEYDDQTKRVYLYNYDGTARLFYHPFEFDTTYHIVGIFDMPNGIMRLYLDGIEVGNIACGNSSNASSDLKNYICLSAHSTRYYGKGIIDEVAMFNKVLTAVEITELYQLSIPVSTYEAYAQALTPLAYWRLNEVSGTVAYDSTNNNDGTMVGSPTLGVNGLIASNDDKAIQFNGNSADYVEIPASIANYAIRTIVLSFAPNVTFNSSSPSAQMILYRADGSSVADFGVYLYAGTGALRFSVRSTGTTYLVNTDIVEWVAGTNYHIVCTIDSTNGMAIYVDGVKQTETTTHTSSIAASSGTDIHLGRIDVSGNYRPYDGVADDLIFYASALTSAEVDELYQLSV